MYGLFPQAYSGYIRLFGCGAFVLSLHSQLSAPVTAKISFHFRRERAHASTMGYRVDGTAPGYMLHIHTIPSIQLCGDKIQLSLLEGFFKSRPVLYTVSFISPSSQPHPFPLSNPYPHTVANSINNYVNPSASSSCSRFWGPFSSQLRYRHTDKNGTGRLSLRLRLLVLCRTNGWNRFDPICLDIYCCLSVDGG